MELLGGLMDRDAATRVVDAVRACQARTREARATLSELASRVRAGRNVVDADVLERAEAGIRQAERALDGALRDLVVLREQIERGPRSDDPAQQAWAESVAGIQGRLQDALRAANDEASVLADVLTPALATARAPERASRWGATWPADATRAERTFRRMAPQRRYLDERDVQVGELRFARGLTQPEIAYAMGVSQPSIAQRLARIESLISLEIAGDRLRERAAAEGWLVGQWLIPESRSREPVGAQMQLTRPDAQVFLDVVDLADTRSSTRRFPLPDPESIEGIVRTYEQNLAAGLEPGQRLGLGDCLYRRVDGALLLLRKDDFLRALRRASPRTIETILDHLVAEGAPAPTFAALLDGASATEGGAATE